MTDLTKLLFRTTLLTFLLSVVTACGGGVSSSSIKTPHDNAIGQLIRTSEDEGDDDGFLENAAPPRGGRMDGVEYYISQELGRQGSQGGNAVAVALGGDYGSEGTIWRPRRGYDIPVVRNDRVEKWINIFTKTKLRNNFERWLTRASYYAPVMEDILRKHNLPHDLIYLSMIESGFNLNAYSSAAAAGPWQFIGSTGRLYGLQSGSVIDERRDLVKATTAAAEHLKDLYKLYGDWYLAFAAYNAGAGKVNSAIRKAGTRDYWALSSPKSKVLRQETKDYVPRILAAAIIAKNYRKYGFSPDIFDKPLNFAAVTVPDATDLSVIARCSGVSVDEIKSLNTSCVMGITPPGRSYTVHVPKGTEDNFRQNYAKLSKSERLQFVFHKVGKRESLATISKRYGMSRGALASVNHLGAKAVVMPGQVLMIPSSRGARNLKNLDFGPEPVVARAPKVQATSVAAAVEPVEPVLQEGAVAPAPVASPSPAVVTATPQTYRVARGDTLSTIAGKNGMTVKALMAANGLAKSNLKVGQVLKLGGSKTVTTVAKAPVKPAVASAAPVAKKPIVVAANNKVIFHHVRRGETLWDLSRKYNVPVDMLKKWNRLTRNQLYPKQRLKIIAEAPTAPKKVAVN